ncbi:MAG: hypothetical protein HY751_11565 [Nitrospinae bacterium]|nr:hypothetical protein [Nitrospinota bacterium]
MENYYALGFFAALTVLMITAFAYMSSHRIRLFRENLRRLGVDDSGISLFSSARREFIHEGYKFRYIQPKVDREDVSNDTHLAVFHRKPFNIGLLVMRSGILNFVPQDVAGIELPYYRQYFSVSGKVRSHSAIEPPASLSAREYSVYALAKDAGAGIFSSPDVDVALLALLEELEGLEGHLVMTDVAVDMVLPNETELERILLEKARKVSEAMASVGIFPATPPAASSGVIFRTILILLLLALIAAIGFVVFTSLFT